MLKRTIITLTIGLFFGSFVSFCWFKHRMPKDYAFYYELPNFSSEEKVFIRDNYCKIYSNLEEPERFYISSIHLGDSTIVDVTYLGTLQDGSNSNQTVISISFDQSIRLIFDKEGQLLFKGGHNP